MSESKDVKVDKEVIRISDSKIPDGFHRCPKCNGSFYYNNSICYSCYGTGIRVKLDKNE